MIIDQAGTPANDSEAQTILILAANPAEQPYLSLDREVREIANGLRRSRQKFRIERQVASTPHGLQRLLRDSQPAFVHFCGHGTGVRGIMFEGQLVNGGALAGLFGLFASTIKCVVLNACYSHVQARAIARHIDYVVGMNKAIGDVAAVEFAASFYDAIGAGEDVETAFNFGRNAIQLANLPEHLTPELLVRDSRRTVRFSSRDRDWDGAPAVSLLYGREAVAEMLRSWIVEDFCRIVLITGMGGIGKSDLASCLGRGANRTPDTSWTLAAGIEGHFDAVLWRSLLNAPPPSELFADIVGVLAENDRPLPSTAEERMNEVVACLEQRRCLVILDNVEAVLRADDPDMRYRAGFELYGNFFARVAKTDHPSCLLLTSRENPYPITTLAGDRKPVRSCRLEGIDSRAVRSVFAEIGTFTASDETWTGIAGMYGGNPLAMELVARHIDEIYGGNVEDFVRGGAPLFRDVETLLDWHFERLTDRQKEIIDWLAVEREPVSLTTLREDLLTRASREEVASTLQGLQRRLPVEHRGTQFTLQPVLTEHATARIVRRVSAALRTAIAEAVGTLADGGSPKSSFEAMRLLNSHALIKASSKEHVREMQERLILHPIAEEIGSQWRGSEVRLALDTMLHLWRGEIGSRRGYAASNVIHLLKALGIGLDHLDVSRLPVWDACLADVNLHATEFSFADFRHTRFRQAFGTVFCVGYSPDGTLIAAGDDNGHVLVFNASSGQLTKTLIGHADAIGALAFAPDGRFIVSGSYDNTVRVWSMADGHCTHILPGHDAWVYGVAVSPDGRSVASASEDGTCRLWELESGSSQRLPTVSSKFLATVAFSPDGQQLATAGSGGAVQLFTLDDLHDPVLLSRHTGGVRAVAFSRQGDLLASGGEDGKVILWSAANGDFVAALEGHTAAVMSLSFSAAGDVLASASIDHTIRLWSTVRPECVARLQAGDTRVWAVACNPAGRTLAAASEDSTIRVWDIDARERLATMHGYSNKTWGVAYCARRKRLVAGNEDGVARVWDPRDARITRELRGHATRIWAVACSADGRWAATASDDATVRLWDLESGNCRHVLRHGHTDWIRAVAFDPASRLVASAAEDGRLMLWDVDQGTRIVAIDSTISRLFATEFCRGSELVATAGTGTLIRIFLSANGEPVADLRGHEGWLNALVAVDENTLLSCSSDNTAKLWNLSSWECSLTFDAGTKVWAGGAWPAGTSVLTGSDDGLLIRWNSETGRREAEVRAHQGPIWSVAVDPGTLSVATAGDDGTIRLWSLPDLIPCAAPNALRSPRPYEGMNITGASGLADEQTLALATLGAITMPSH